MPEPPPEPTVEPTLDHLVYAAPELEDTAAQLAELLGVRPVAGGRHVGLGTRNLLLGLGGRAYLEIIGPDVGGPAPEGPRPFGIDDLSAPRLVTWAVRPTDVDAAIVRARAAGHDPGPARAMSRRTPSGELLAWRLTAPADGGPRAAHGLLPFLIDWGTTPHPTSSGMPSVALVGLSARHPDPEAVTAGLAALGVRLDVVRGTPPALVAVLRGVHGDVTLS